MKYSLDDLFYCLKRESARVLWPPLSDSEAAFLVYRIVKDGGTDYAIGRILRDCLLNNPSREIKLRRDAAKIMDWLRVEKEKRLGKWDRLDWSTA